MTKNKLEEIAKKMVARGKGILAADESVETAGKRLAEIGVLSSDETRRQYRELFLGLPNLGDYISGVILHEETLSQKSDSGKFFPEHLSSVGVLPGIKVDGGTDDLSGFSGEKFTKGLDGLESRLQKFKASGAVFTKWRSVIQIGAGIPTNTAIETNMSDMARYAKIAQDNELVPIVEPEVLLDGDHTVQVCEDVLTKTLTNLFEKLTSHKVSLSGLILKTSMVLSGNKSGQKIEDQEVATRTVSVLKKTVPTNVPGVVFLSGGQEAKEATRHLNEIAKLEPLPWEIAFSYARALQGPALEVWLGKKENWEKAREVFLKRLELNIKADGGSYDSALEA